MKEPNKTCHTSNKPNVKEVENTSTKTANCTKDQMRPKILHNIEDIIQNVSCTTNQSMSHVESNNSNTRGITSTLDHQPLKQSDTAKMKKGSRQYRKTYNS